MVFFDHGKPTFDVFRQAVLRAAKLLCLIKFVHGIIIFPTRGNQYRLFNDNFF